MVGNENEACGVGNENEACTYLAWLNAPLRSMREFPDRYAACNRLYYFSIELQEDVFVGFLMSRGNHWDHRCIAGVKVFGEPMMYLDLHEFPRA